MAFMAATPASEASVMDPAEMLPSSETVYSAEQPAPRKNAIWYHPEVSSMLKVLPEVSQAARMLSSLLTSWMTEEL